MGKSKNTTTKVTNNEMGNLVESAVDIFKRLIENSVEAAKRNGPDNGHAIPTQPNLVWFFRRICQVCYETLDLEGRVSQQSGKRVYSLKETLAYREEQFRKLQAKHSGDDENLVSDPQYDPISRSLDSAVENFSVFLMLDAWAKEMFAHVTHGEDFKPWVAPTNTVIKAAMDKASAAKRLEELAALRQKVA
jgi:hypothetical protein